MRDVDDDWFSGNETAEMMNLQQNLRYPLTKFLAEELSGRFYDNELSCLNRMLILYQNRVSFAIDGSERHYLDEYQIYLAEPVNFWWIPVGRLRQINALRRRMLLVLGLQQQIFDDLLSKPDFCSLSRKLETIRRIRDWLAQQPDGAGSKPELIAWRDSISAQYDHLFDASAAKTSPKSEVTDFYQVLTGSDEIEKKIKFARLIKILQRQGWLSLQAQDGRYRFRNRSKSSRLQIGALFKRLTPADVSSRGLQPRLLPPFLPIGLIMA